MDGNYRAYMLRLQKLESNDTWRATLQNVQTGETYQFADEIKMVSHLLRLLAEPVKNITETHGDNMH